MSDGLLTAREAAGLLRISDESVYRLCRSGKLGAIRIGGLWRIPREAVDLILHPGQVRKGTDLGPAGDKA